MKRKAVGVWACGVKNCRVKMAGGAWTVSTTAAVSVRWDKIKEPSVKNMEL